MDLSSTLSIIQGAMGTTGQLQGQAKSAHGLEQAGIVQEGGASVTKVLQDGIVSMEAAKGKMQAEQNARKLATALGTNLDEPNEILTTLANLARSQSLQASEESAKVAQMEANSDLFSNPAGFFYDLLYGDGERSKRDAMVDGAAQQKALLDGLNATTTAGAQAQNAIATTITDASLAAQQESINAAATMQEGLIKQALAGADYKMISQLSSLNAQQVSMASAGYQIGAMAEQRAWARADAEARREDRNMLRKIADEEKAADMETLELYNLGVQASGTSTAVPIKTLAQLNQQIKLDKDKVLRLLDFGSKTKFAGVIPSLGKDPIEAIGNIIALDVPMNEAQKTVVQQLDTALSGATSPKFVAQVLNLDPNRDAVEIANILKDKDQVARLRQLAVQSRTAGDLELQKPSDAANVYAPAALEYFMEMDFAKENAWLQKYVAPQAEGKDFDLNWLTSRGVEAVNASEATTSEVTEAIVWLSEMAALRNNTTKLYRQRFGMEDQVGVTQEVNIRTGKVFGSNQIERINGANPTEVTDVINRKLRDWNAGKNRDAISKIYREVVPMPDKLFFGSMYRN